MRCCIWSHAPLCPRSSDGVADDNEQEEDDPAEMTADSSPAQISLRRSQISQCQQGENAENLPEKSDSDAENDRFPSLLSSRSLTLTVVTLVTFVTRTNKNAFTGGGTDTDCAPRVL